ncbi:hydroxyisourate hydrolase [Chryseobacterium sp. JUb7]|uniref:hydroxyisourate hydrolase n=1 Tax=Chryseobacterium sp. JUb7 TaxID=2940599 RepID=UPI0021686D3D|nr:hydroxyisourate hydrolase [Chryseobacterium sp. JUb7]MCS3530080.1 5-hydroxyisourate hydrolase [Chryseobacterium sp. JUb7]
MKKFLVVFFGVLFLSLSAQEKGSFQVSSHILDISEGHPAGNVNVELEKYNESTRQWVSLSKKQTDSNGRIGDFLPYSKGTENNGKYKLIFFTGDYYKSKKIDSFYPYIEIIFQIKDNQHYHVPISLSPFGYSTYRGS